MADVYIIIASGLTQAQVDQIEGIANAFRVQKIPDAKVSDYAAWIVAGMNNPVDENGDPIAAIDVAMERIKNGIQIACNRGKRMLNEVVAADVFE